MRDTVDGLTRTVRFAVRTYYYCYYTHKVQHIRTYDKRDIFFYFNVLSVP